MDENTKFSARNFITIGLMSGLFAVLVLKESRLPLAVLVLLGIGGALFLLFKGLSEPVTVLYVLVAYMPFSKVLAGDFGGLAQALNLTNLLIGFILLLWVSGRYDYGGQRLTSSNLDFLINLFMFLGCIAVIRSSSYAPEFFTFAFVGFKRWVTPVFLYFLFLNTVKDRSTIQNIVIIMIMVTTLVGLMAIYDYIDLGDVGSLEKSRIGGITGHSNSLAAFFNYYMFLPVAFYLMNTRAPHYWLLLIPFLIQFRGIMVTFSRGGYLAFAFGVYALIFIRNKFLFVLLIFLTAVLAIFPVLLPAGIRMRMGQTFEKDTTFVSTSPEELEGTLEASSKNRVEIWRGAVQIIKEYPLTGIGYGRFPEVIQHYWSGGFMIDAHNTYLIIAAEMGIPTLLIFLLLLLVIFWNTFVLYYTTQNEFAKSTALGFIGGLFALLVSNMFGSRLDSQEISSYFWILAALITRLLKIDQEEAAHAREHSEDSEDENPPEDTPQKPAPPKKKSQKLDACWTEDNEVS